MEDKEMKMLYDWSIRHKGSYKYTEENKDAKSYFIKHEKDEYIGEYGFETIVNLKTELGFLWSGDEVMEEIMKVVAVAAMKKSMTDSVSKSKTDILDEFIYIF